MKSSNKQAEVGILPGNWDVKKIEQIGVVVRGGSPRPAGDPRYFNGKYIPWLTVAALTNIPEHQLEVNNTFSSLTEEGAKRSRTLEPGTIIIANSGATLGVAKILGLKCCANDGIAAILELEEGDKHFICQYINTQTKRLREIVATGNGQPNLNTTLIKNIFVPFPPIEEQQAIAKALGDMDGLLAALERLIAKKRAVKTAVMQQLLTGQKRLPGFNGRWLTRTFDECFSFLPTGSNARRELSDNGEVGYIHYGDIHTQWSLVLDCDKETLPFIDSNKVKNLSFLQDGDLVIVDASEDYEGVGYSVEVKNVRGRKIVAGLHTLLLRADKHILADGFKAYITSIRPVKIALQKIATGISVYGISKTNLRNVDILLPPTIEEQKAIANVLSDMDAEIAALEARRAKTQAIKQGMMQELLTGGTRLL